MKKNKDRSVFLQCDRACRHASPCFSLFLVSMSIFSQIDEFANASITPAVSVIAHLLPCKIALKWGNPSVEALCWTLIKFTARRRDAECDAFAYGRWPSLTETTVANQPRKHFNLPPGMLVPLHFKRPLWAILLRWKHSRYQPRGGTANMPQCERLAHSGAALRGKMCSSVIFLFETKL